MSLIPWDDELFTDDERISPRPAFLPCPGEPCDLATARRIMAWYGPEIAATLERIERAVLRWHPRFAKPGLLTARVWTAAEIVTHWSPDLDAVLVGYVGVDDRPSGGSFYSVLAMIDKVSGELSVQDETGRLST